MTLWPVLFLTPLTEQTHLLSPLNAKFGTLEELNSHPHMVIIPTLSRFLCFGRQDALCSAEHNALNTNFHFCLDMLQNCSPLCKAHHHKKILMQFLHISILGLTINIKNNFWYSIFPPPLQPDHCITNSLTDMNQSFGYFIMLFINFGWFFFQP